MTRQIDLDVSHLEPMITYGTNPGMGMPISQAGARPGQLRATQPAGRPGEGAALHGPAARPPAVRPAGGRGFHRQLHKRAASPICARRPHCCTGAKWLPASRLVVVPGSENVRRQAEAEGLDRIFLEAGGEWR